MKIIRKIFGLLFFIIAATSLLSSCANDLDMANSDDSYFAPDNYPSNTTDGFGTFNGVWTVNSEKLGNAELEVFSSNYYLTTNNGTENRIVTKASLTIPKKYLTTLSFPDAKDISVDDEDNTTIIGTAGNSSNTYFYEMSSIINSTDWYEAYNFKAVVDGESYQIDVMSRDQAIAFYTLNTGLWTISIPVDHIEITGKDGMKAVDLKQTVTLLYTATEKKQITLGGKRT